MSSEPEQLEINESPEDSEAAEIRAVLADKGVPTEKTERGKGKFGRPKKAAAPRPAEPEVIEEDDDDEDSAASFATDSPAEEPRVEKAPQKAKKPEPVAEEQAQPNLLGQLAQEILKAPPTPLDSFQMREEKRAKDENQRLRELTEVLLEQMQREKNPPPAEEEDSDDDFLLDPKGSVQKVLKKELIPLQQMLEDLKTQQIVNTARANEQAFASQNPDYFQAIDALRQYGLHRYMNEYGLSQEKAIEILKEDEQSIIRRAEQLGKTPWELAYQAAKPVLDFVRQQQGESQPAPQQPAPVAKPKGRDASIAAARAAANSPVSGTFNRSTGGDMGGNGRITVDTILESGVDGAQVRELLNRGGKDAFFSLLNEVERKEMAARKR